MDTSENFEKAYATAKNYYEKEVFPNAEISSKLLDSLNDALNDAPSHEEGLRWIEEKCESMFSPKTVADYKLPIDAIEYAMRSLKWSEGNDFLKSLFNRLVDPSLKMELEVMIKRYYDPNWSGGDFEIKEFPLTIWDLAEGD